MKVQNIDPEVLRMGFSLLPALEKSQKGRGDALAVTLGNRLGKNFTANQNDPKYQDGPGLSADYFADTTKNALTWWRRHEKTTGRSLN